jgi:peroxiredoxin
MAKTLPNPKPTNEPPSSSDTTGAKIARFAMGAVFGVIFLVAFFILLTAALRGPDTVTVGGVTAPAGLLPNQELPQAQLKIGDRAPDFVLNQLGGDPVQLSKLLAQGNAVVLNFWASWCEPCVKEMPDLNTVYKASKNTNVKILTVNYREDEGQAKSFFKNNNLTMPILLDKEGKVAGGYKATGFPESFFISKDGIVREVAFVELTKAEFEQKIKTTLDAAK